MGAPLDAVAFHVQQTAEKILKALLASRDIEYLRTHDVEAAVRLPREFRFHGKEVALRNGRKKGRKEKR